DQLLVEALHAELLEVPRLRPALLEPGQVLLRREELEDVELVGGEVAVPERGAAARHHGHLLGSDAVPAELAARERDPVLELVADLAEKRAEQNSPLLAACATQRSLRQPRLRPNLRLPAGGAGDLPRGTRLHPPRLAA